MDKFEEEKKKYEHVSRIYEEVLEQCHSYHSCIECPYGIARPCLRCKLAERKDVLLKGLEHMEQEQAFKKLIEERAKEIEEMTKAMMSVKHDDWELVQIRYAENETAAVAFVKKGTELKKNMIRIDAKHKSIMDKTLARIHLALDAASCCGKFFEARKKVYDVLAIEDY